MEEKKVSSPPESLDKVPRGLQDVSASYSRFVTSHYSPNALLCVIIGFVIYHFGEVAGVYGPWLPSGNPALQVMALVMRVLALSCLFLIWFLKMEGEETPRSPVVHTLRTWLPQLQALNPALVSMVHSFLSYQVLFCSPTGTGSVGNSIQLNLALAALKLYPLISYFLLRDTWLPSIVLSWVIGVVTCFSCSFYLERPDRLSELMYYAVGTGLILIDSARQDQNIFRLVTTLEGTLKEVDRLAVAAQALELKALLGNVAHDLKTPLTSFLGGIEFMRDVLSSWEEQLDAIGSQSAPGSLLANSDENIAALRKCLANMEQTNSFMLMTINRCLDYTKASKGVKLVPKFETVCVKDEVAFTVNLLQDIRSAISIHIVPMGQDICSHIITDKQWLMENLLCLLSNAVKYSNRGTIDVSIHFETPPAVAGIDACAGEPHLRFEVQDMGVGLSEEAMASLFNPFKQAQRLAGGTGLGLFSLAMRQEAINGRYGVSQRPDCAQGSLFWFTIPYRPDAMSAKLTGEGSLEKEAWQPRRETQEIPEDEKQIAACGNVLVVDDAPMIVKMTSFLLRCKGHSVQHAVNGAEALEKIHQAKQHGDPPYDAVLMDLQMPVLDGIEAIRRLRREEQGDNPEQEVPSPSIASTNTSTSTKTSASSASTSNTSSSISAVGEFSHEPLSQPLRPQQQPSPQPSDTVKSIGKQPPHQFVIAVSANSDEATKQEALTAGADAFMCKPFTYDTFQSLVTKRGP